MTERAPDATALLEELTALESAARPARFRAAGPPDELLPALAAAAERLAVTDAGRALIATECLLPLADGAASDRARSLVLRARAHALCNAGRLQEGWLACEQAAELADAAGEPVEAGLARLRSMQALGELGRFDESIDAGRRALVAFEAAGADQLAARAEVNLGIVHHRRDEPARAMEFFDRARPRLAGDALAAGTVDNNRGEALLALDDLAGAEAAFRSALTNYERAEAGLVAAVAEGNLADLAARQGSLPRAMAHFERARRRFEATGSAGHLARLLTEQAEAMNVLGLPADALALYRQALPRLDQGGFALEAARARAGLGRALLRIGKLSEAETALTAAAAAFDQLGHASARGQVDLVRAELAAAHGRVEEARRLVHGALAVLHSRPIEAAASRHLLARLALAEDDEAVAGAELTAALELARRLDLAPLLAEILHTSGRLHARRGDPDAAVNDFLAATAQIERVRGALQAERFRGAYLGDRLAVYHDLVTALLDRNAPDAAARAFAAAEQARSRLLLEAVQGAVSIEQPDDDDPHDRRLAAAFARAQAELNALYSRLADEQRQGGALDERWRRRVADRERLLEELQSRLASARGTAALYAPPVAADAAAAALPAGTTLIEYLIAGNEVLAFVLGDGDPVVARRLTDAPRLEDRVGRLSFQINRALRPDGGPPWRRARLVEDARAELCALHRMLLAPLRDAVPDGRRLLIVPHGPLHAVPFEALWDGDGHLLERHEIHYAPSASLYARLPRSAEATRRRALVVGVADDAAPRIEDEAKAVAALIAAAPADVLLGADATSSAVREAATGAALLHLACHATFAPATPLGSGVRLADRWLTARDVCGLRLDAAHVTLAGCDTGRSLVAAGDELIGLVRAFLAAGASSMLVSRWRLDDETALRIMSDFYRRWRYDGCLKAAALRQAQLDALAERPHPAFWAPFHLVGRP